MQLQEELALLSYAKDIRPLFRDTDVNAMTQFGGFDLSQFEDVFTWADEILKRLEVGDMPCDAPWPAERVALFKQWINDGKLA